MDLVTTNSSCFNSGDLLMDFVLLMCLNLTSLILGGEIGRIINFYDRNIKSYTQPKTASKPAGKGRSYYINDDN